MATRRPLARNNHLEEAMALLIRNQAAFVEQIARNDQERLKLQRGAEDWQLEYKEWRIKNEEWQRKTEARLADIEATLVEMPKIILQAVLDQAPKTIIQAVLDQLPKAVKKEIGFKSPTLASSSLLTTTSRRRSRSNNPDRRIFRNRDHEPSSFAQDRIFPALEPTHQRQWREKNARGDRHRSDFADMARSGYSSLSHDAFAFLSFRFQTPQLIAARRGFRRQKYAAAIGGHDIFHGPREFSGFSPVPATLCLRDACGDERARFDNRDVVNHYGHENAKTYPLARFQIEGIDCVSDLDLDRRARRNLELRNGRARTRIRSGRLRRLDCLVCAGLSSG